MTKGSFYHHFSGIDAFVDALLQAWEASFAGILERSTGSDPLRQAEATLAVMAGLPHETEAALRAWALSNASVAAAVRRQDRAREQWTQGWLSQLVDDPERCRVLGFMGLSMIAGMQQRPLDRELILEASVEFLRSNLGLVVERTETSEGPRFRVSF